MARRVEQLRSRQRPAWQGPWRTPGEETHDYPGLCVSDNRVSGSITVGCSRLPIWAFAGWLPTQGWDEVVECWEYIETEYGFDAEKMGGLLCDVFEQRGEFGRLILVLADMERRERTSRSSWPVPWWTKKRSRVRVRKQLERCIAALDMEDTRG